MNPIKWSRCSTYPIAVDQAFVIGSKLLQICRYIFKARSIFFLISGALKVLVEEKNTAASWFTGKPFHRIFHLNLRLKCWWLNVFWHCRTVLETVCWGNAWLRWLALAEVRKWALLLPLLLLLPTTGAAERGSCARSGKVAATLLRPRSAAHCINRSFSTNLPGLAEPALFPFFQLAVAIATTGGCWVGRFPMCFAPFVRLVEVERQLIYKNWHCLGWGAWRGGCWEGAWGKVLSGGSKSHTQHSTHPDAANLWASAPLGLSSTWWCVRRVGTCSIPRFSIVVIEDWSPIYLNRPGFALVVNDAIVTAALSDLWIY